MSLFVDRRELKQFCVLLFSSVIFAIIARLTAESRMPLAIGSFIVAILLAWVAVIREINASAIYFPVAIKKAVHWIHAQTLELIAFALLIFLRLATVLRKNQPAAPLANSRPILLVHGYLNSGFVWDFHKNHLVREGFGPIYTIDLGNPFLSIRTYAKKVQEMAKKIAEETGQNDLTLIGHSMGGLVSYYYAAKLARAYSVPQVITIGSPLHGTQIAKIGLGMCAKEMQIGSNLIQEIHEAVESCPDVRFYNIATKTDELVVPYTSSIFKSDPLSQFVVDDVGHASLLFSQRVSDQLCRWLRS